MDTLVALGSGASFAYSTYALFAMTGAQVRMDMDAVMHYMDEFYFESAAMILTLITVGKMLEAYSKGKTTRCTKEPDGTGSEEGNHFPGWRRGIGSGGAGDRSAISLSYARVRGFRWMV